MYNPWQTRYFHFIFLRNQVKIWTEAKKIFLKNLGDKNELQLMGLSMMNLIWFQKYLVLIL